MGPKKQNCLVSSPVFARDFRARAQRYGRYVRTYHDPELAFLMLENLRFKQALLALDLACGQGDGSRHLRCLGIETFYIDGTSEMIMSGIGKGNIPKDKSVVANICANWLPFKQNTFDIIVCRYAFHDFENPNSLLKEICRLLKGNGILQIVDMSHTDHDALRFYNRLHAWKTLARSQRNCHIVGMEEYETLLKEAGLEIIDRRWYTSRVHTQQWVKEGQITPERHEFLKTFIQKELQKSSQLVRQFGIQLLRGGFSIDFPVIIISGRKY